MICPSCNTPGMIHAGGHTGNGECKNYPRCRWCNGAFNADGYREGCEEAAVMRSDGLCFSCAFWELRARKHEKNPGRTLVIGGHFYAPDASNTVPVGAPDPHPYAKNRGMAGRRFDFERFDGSPAQSCYSLWSGGDIAEQVRHRIPDNARFLNGATQEQVGETTCFNPSRGAA